MHVIIIGAGPAGCSCAIQLLKAGVNVTIVDKQSFPRNAPGETLHPGIEPLLQQIDMLAKIQNEDFIKHAGIYTMVEGKRSFEAYNEKENWMGYQLFRKTFDAMLLNKAISSGAIFFKKGIIKVVEVNNSTITKIKTNYGDLTADFYIDATGINAFLAKKLKIIYQYNSPKLIAYYGYVHIDNTSSVDFSAPSIIWDNKGWTWLSQVTNDLVAWNRLVRVNDKTAKDWLPTELKTYTATGPRKAVDVTWRIAGHVSKNNYFLTGDAAFVLDPASSHGVIKAIMSGIMTAYLINKIKTETPDLTTIHLYYSNWIKSWYNEDVIRLKTIYRSKGLFF